MIELNWKLWIMCLHSMKTEKKLSRNEGLIIVSHQFCATYFFLSIVEFPININKITVTVSTSSESVTSLLTYLPALRPRLWENEHTRHPSRGRPASRSSGRPRSLRCFPGSNGAPQWCPSDRSWPALSRTGQCWHLKILWVEKHISPGQAGNVPGRTHQWGRYEPNIPNR